MGAREVQTKHMGDKLKIFYSKILILFLFMVSFSSSVDSKQSTVHIIKMVCG